MGIVRVKNWPASSAVARKKRPGRKDARHAALDGSLCELDIRRRPDKELLSVDITFHGPAAAIPSLKNSKMPGCNFAEPKVMGRIDAMSKMFYDTALVTGAGVHGPWFGADPILLLLICGDRSGPFDVIGCLETVQDWLEPATKRVGRQGRRRGWGVGLIDNDSQVTPVAVHSHQLGFPHEHTIIRLRRFDRARESLINFAAAMVLK